MSFRVTSTSSKSGAELPPRRSNERIGTWHRYGTLTATAITPASAPRPKKSSRTLTRHISGFPLTLKEVPLSHHHRLKPHHHRLNLSARKRVKRNPNHRPRQQPPASQLPPPSRAKATQVVLSASSFSLAFSSSSGHRSTAATRNLTTSNPPTNRRNLNRHHRQPQTRNSYD